MGAAIVAGISLVSSFIEARKKRKSTANQAQNSLNKQSTLADEQFQIASELYKSYSSTFGDIETNLGAYYSNLTPERAAAQGLQAQQKEFQALRDTTRQNLAQRGLSGSKFEDYLSYELDSYNSEKRADIRDKAIDETVEQKQKFLGLGYNSLGTRLQYLGNAQGNQQNAAVTQAQFAQANNNRADSREQDFKAFGTAYGLYEGLKKDDAPDPVHPTDGQELLPKYVEDIN